MASDILALIEKHTATLRQRGVTRIGLFGSTVRNEAMPSSDIDILVELESPSLTEYMGLKFYLEEILDYPVDLVLTDNLREELRPAILNEVVYAQSF